MLSEYLQQILIKYFIYLTLMSWNKWYEVIHARNIYGAFNFLPDQAHLNTAHGIDNFVTDLISQNLREKVKIIKKQKQNKHNKQHYNTLTNLAKMHWQRCKGFNDYKNKESEKSGSLKISKKWVIEKLSLCSKISVK